MSVITLEGRLRRPSPPRCGEALARPPGPARAAAAAGRLALLAIAVLCFSATAGARVLVNQDEALKLAFPGAEVRRDPVFLTDDQRSRAAELAGEPIPGKLVLRHVARRDGRVVGTAYFDTHRVRTLPEALMIVVAPDGAVARVEVLSFDEPDEYRPRGAWYAQFPGRDLDDELALKRGIRGVTGATLTARATTAAVRRVLAIHRVLGDGGPQRGEESAPDARGPEPASGGGKEPHR